MRRADVDGATQTRTGARGYMSASLSAPDACSTESEWPPSDLARGRPRDAGQRALRALRGRPSARVPGREGDCPLSAADPRPSAQARDAPTLRKVGSMREPGNPSLCLVPAQHGTASLTGVFQPSRAGKGYEDEVRRSDQRLRNAGWGGRKWSLAPTPFRPSTSPQTSATIFSKASGRTASKPDPRRTRGRGGAQRVGGGGVPRGPRLGPKARVDAGLPHLPFGQH